MGVDASAKWSLNPSMNDQDILRRLKDLERENARLKNIVSGSPVKETITHVSMYKGHPVITFSGAFRPFTLGVRKASIVLEKLAEVKHFVENNRKHIASGSDDVEPPAPTV